VTVVDYKFGTVKREAYAGQVAEYVRRIRMIGYRDVEGYVWYARLGRTVKSV